MYFGDISEEERPLVSPDQTSIKGVRQMGVRLEPRGSVIATVPELDTIVAVASWILLVVEMKLVNRVEAVRQVVPVGVRGRVEAVRRQVEEIRLKVEVLLRVVRRLVVGKGVGVVLVVHHLAGVGGNGDDRDCEYSTHWCIDDGPHFTYSEW